MTSSNFVGCSKGEILGFGAFEDLVDERRRMAKQVRVVSTVTSQAACFHILPGTDNGRQSMFDRQITKPLTVGKEHRARDDVDRPGTMPYQSGERRL